ncbi:MAG: hypothetical protein M3068_00805 [Gemmatimonadota bacterium]|nr:hypothetical protein [Gemmatimonadota bacterium]
MGRFLPPDHSLGDEKTLGGYMAVHARPAAFEGADGLSYSVDILTDDSGSRDQPVDGYLLFVRWGRGEPGIAGHLESDVLARGQSEEDVRRAIGELTLDAVKALLDSLIGTAADPELHGERPWYEAMRDEDGTP